MLTILFLVDDPTQLHIQVTLSQFSGSEAIKSTWICEGKEGMQNKGGSGRDRL